MTGIGLDESDDQRSKLESEYDPGGSFVDVISGFISILDMVVLYNIFGFTVGVAVTL